MGKADFGFGIAAVFCLAYMVTDSMDSRSNSPEMEPGLSSGAPTEQEWSDVPQAQEFVDQYQVQSGDGFDRVAQRCAKDPADVPALSDGIEAAHNGRTIHPGEIIGVPAVLDSAGVQIVIECPDF